MTVPKVFKPEGSKENIVVDKEQISNSFILMVKVNNLLYILDPSLLLLILRISKLVHFFNL